MCKSSKNLIRVLLSALILAVALLPSVSFAAGPEWSTGFPKMINKNALLQWNPVKGAGEYKVYRSEEGGATKLLATIRVNKYIDKGLPSGKRFTYYVAAVTGGKEGARSAAGSAATARAKVFVPMRAPRLVGSLIKDQPNGKATVGVRWEGAEGTNMIGVNVYRSKVKGKDFMLVGSSSTDSLEDTDVERGATYYYAATSVDNQFGETKYSNELKVDVPTLQAEAPKPTAKTPITKMKKARLLFTIQDYYDYGPDGKPVKKALDYPHDVVVDEAVGHIYVTDFGYHGVLVFGLDGKFQFGIKADGVGGKKDFINPQGLTIGPDGNLYVADDQLPDVSVFNIEGKLIRTIKVDLSYLPKYAGKKARIFDVSVSPDGLVYAADYISNRIHVYDLDGKRLFDCEISKDRAKNFNGPSFITLDKGKDLVVVDTGGSKLRVYSPKGKYIRDISEIGFNAGQLNYPAGVAAGSGGEVLVASGVDSNIQAFDPKTGKFLYALCNDKTEGPIPSGSIRGIYEDSAKKLYVVESQMGKVSVYQLDDGLVELIPK